MMVVVLNGKVFQVPKPLLEFTPTPTAEIILGVLGCWCFSWPMSWIRGCLC